MTAPRPGAGALLTLNAAVDVAAAARGDGGTPARQNTIRVRDVRNPNQTTGGGHHHHHHHRVIDMGPYRDEDVLLNLQLLAYLSKYSHRWQDFYKSCTRLCPAPAQLMSEARGGLSSASSSGSSSRANAGCGSSSAGSAAVGRDVNAFVKMFNSVT